MTNNSTLRADIEAELEFEPSLDAAGIGVAVTDGVATLSGHVASYAQKVAAERATSRVKGVRAFAEEIEVRLPFNVKHDDEEIARRAANILDWDIFVPANKVHVKVEKGWVTLTGALDWKYQKESSEQAIRRLAGVMGVSNLITIQPHVSAGDVHDRIAQAYRRNAELESSGIRVSIEGGKVTLSGKVKAWSERRSAENAAWGNSSVTEVVDHLMVA